MNLLAIDSGADPGWALFVNNQLVRCGAAPFPKELLGQFDRLVLEKPHTAKTRARRKDILKLAIHAGEIGGIWSFLSGVKPKYIEPRVWKGTASKEISHARIKTQLSPEELTHIPPLPKTRLHNVMDAIGIGLYVLDR